MAKRQGKVKAPNGIPRLRREAGVPFGRSEMGAPSGDLTDLGCPDCRGVLAVRDEGDKGHLAFTCRVGHAFSGDSLIKVKEEQLENCIWTTLEVFEEVVLIHQELAARAHAAGVRRLATAYDRRVKRARTHMATLREIVSEDFPATHDGARSKG
jgi:two-component system chemotaxis response regulator CheB